MNAKFWLEERKPSVNNDKSTLSIQNISINHKSKAKALVKKNTKISQVEYAQAAFTILSHKHTGQSQFNYYLISLANKNKNKPSFKTHQYSSNLNSKVTLSQYIINKQYQKKLPTADSLLDNLHYAVMISRHKPKEVGSIFDNLNLSLLLIITTDKAPSISLAFNKKWFNNDAIKTITRHYKNLILSMQQNPDCLAAKLGMISQSELKQLQTFANGEICDSKFATDISITDHYDALSGKYLKRPAIVIDNTVLTHDEFKALFHKLSHYLKIKYAIKPHDRVVVYIERNPALLIIMFSLFKCGATFVPIHAKYPKSRIEYIIKDSSPCLIIADKKYSALEMSEVPCFYIQSHEDIHEIEIPDQSLETHNNNTMSYAAIVYASQMSENIKGVVIRQDAILNLCNWYCYKFHISQNDRMSQFSSQGFSAFFSETIPFLLIGASVHIPKDYIKLSPPLFFSWLNQHHITLCNLPTSYAKLLFETKWPAIPSLRMVKIGGESINRYPNKLYTFDIWNTYGSSETTIEATYYQIHTACKAIDPLLKNKVPLIGKPICHSECWIVDETLQLAPLGIAGELLIGGINVNTRYWNQPDLNNTKVVANTYNERSNHKMLYRTGDIVRLTKDGNLEYLGRKDQQIKIHGYRIELSEIESTLGQYQDVRDVAVIIQENTNNDKKIMAYIVPNLDRLRFTYHEPCLLFIDHECMEVFSENISKGGICISSIPRTLSINTPVKISIKLPGSANEYELSATVVWQEGDRAGCIYNVNESTQKIINKSIDFYLAMQNESSVLAVSIQNRNWKTALKKKLPKYMIPEKLVAMLELPLTTNNKINKKALPQLAISREGANHYIAPQTETEKKICKIWGKILNKSNIGLQDHFFELGGTSILTAELCMEVMRTFHFTIPAHVIFDLPYPSMQAEYIDSKGKKYPVNQHQLIEEDIILPEDIYPVGKYSEHIENPKNILLTGAQGLLGVYLLRSLLKKTTAKIYCILRQKEFTSVASCFEALIKKFQLDKEISLSNRRIVLLDGDLSKPKFGLSQSAYNNLANKINVIYHAAAQVNKMASYYQLRDSNVIATKEIIKLATRLIDKPIYYISTLSSAYLKNRNNELDERFPSGDPESLSGGYALSMWVSECLIKEIGERGLPVKIFRPGIIGGDSISGVTNTNDALYMLIKGCIQLNAAPLHQTTINLIPIDFVSNSIVAISLNNPLEQRVFNINHPEGILWNNLINWIKKRYGIRISLITIAEWKEKLQYLSRDNALYPLLPYYLALSLEDVTDKVSIHNYQIALKQCGMTIPSIDNSMLATWFDYLCKINFLPVPEGIPDNITE